MSLVRPHLLLTCLLAVLLAACQPLPQPFLPDEKETGQLMPLTMPVGEQSLYVLPVTLANAPDELPRDFAAKLAAALVALDWPASANVRSAASAELVSTLIEDAKGQLVWAWQLARRGSPPLNGEDFPLGLSLEGLQQAPDATRLSLTRAMAQRVVQSLEALESNQRIEAALDPALPKLALLPFDGAPGDGNKTLAAALRDQLLGAGIARVVADPAAADYLVDCAIVISDVGPRLQQVVLAWSLFAPDGQRLGTVNQANRVPRGSLNGAWGDTAKAAAQGGADGLRDMLDRLKTVKR